MNEKIRLLIADDHAIVRAGLVALLKYEKDILVVGEAEDGQDVVDKAAALRPDVVLLDLVMPVMNGAEATARIREISPDSRVLLLTTFGTSTELARAFANGAAGALTKNLPKTELLDALRRTAGGERVVSAEIEDSLRQQEKAPELTPRQIEFLQSVARGLTNKDIATAYGISPGGVKFHLAAIFAKLGAANRSEAVSIALRHRMISG